MSAVIIHPGNNFSNILFKLTLILLTSLYLFIYALTQFQLNTASKRAGRHAVWPSVIILGHIEATRATSRQKSSPISRMAMVCFLHIFICPFLCFLHSSLGKSQSLCNMFPPDDLSSGPYTQSIIRFFFLYIKLMCPYFILLIYTDGERDGLWMACPFRTLVVLYRMFPFIICLILMNYLMEFYFIGFVDAHLPGCFCPWTFRLNIGLNTSPLCHI